MWCDELVSLQFLFALNGYEISIIVAAEREKEKKGTPSHIEVQSIWSNINAITSKWVINFMSNRIVYSSFRVEIERHTMTISIRIICFEAND